jgi:glycerophosphoryl diester phosphodiesterase
MKIFDGDRPVLVGHRGMGIGVVDGYAENTIASYTAAIEAGLTWVEVDVRRSSDDGLVIRHNATTPDGRFVIDQTAAETGLPALREVLDALPPGIGVDIDVKTEFEDATDPDDRVTGTLLAPVLAEEVRRRPMLVKSFDAAVVLRLGEAVPGLRTAMLAWIRYPLAMAVSSAAGLGMDALCLDTRSFALENGADQPGRRPAGYAIDMAHRAGLEVMVWCPDAAEAVWFAQAGADALVVNDPAPILRALAEARATTA